MDYNNFSFLSSRSLDKLALVYPATGYATFNAPSYEFGATITIPHTAIAEFTPIIKYSSDGGTTWYYNGDAKWYYSGSPAQPYQEPTVIAKANSSQIVLTYSNGAIAKTVTYKIYGIAKNV